MVFIDPIGRARQGLADWNATDLEPRMNRPGGVPGYAGVCRDAYDGCEGAKDPETFQQYCEKNDRKNCPITQREQGGQE